MTRNATRHTIIPHDVCVVYIYVSTPNHESRVSVSCCAAVFIVLKIYTKL